MLKNTLQLIKSIAILALLFLVVYLFIYFINPWYNEAGHRLSPAYLLKKQACEKKGGLLIHHFQMKGNFIYEKLPYGCATKYSDGGQACTSSEECQGDCIANYFSCFDCDRNTVKGSCQSNSAANNCPKWENRFNELPGCSI